MIDGASEVAGGVTVRAWVAIPVRTPAPFTDFWPTFLTRNDTPHCGPLATEV